MKRMGMFLFCMMIVVIVAACAGGPPMGSQPFKGTGGPVITNYYCQTKANYGSPLNVYLEVDDPEGNMSHIATVVNQTGYGTYPTSWKYLAYRYRAHFKGYLQWNTMSSDAMMDMPEWTNITITVAVYDKAGNQSNNVVFPVQFVNEAVASPPLPPPFNQGGLPRIGYIDIDLENPNAPDGPMGGPRL